MKRIFFGAAILISALQMNAQTNNLVIFDQQGEPFYAIVNGQRQNNAPQTNVKILGLTGNPVKVTVIFQDSTIPAITKNAYFQENGTEVTYNVIVKKDGEHVLRYNGVVNIPQAPPPPPPPAPVQQQQVIVSNPPPPPPPTSTTVVQQTTTTTTTSDPNMVTSVNMNVGGAGVNMNVGGVQQTTVVTTTTTTDGGMQQAPPPPVQQTPPPPPPPVGCVVMNHEDYEDAKRSISGKDFEDTKLSMAKQITGANNLLAEQIRGIMKLFTFENSKLEFAKFAYSHCCDKSNYYKVNDAFEFDSSSTELNRYISGQ